MAIDKCPSCGNDIYAPYSYCNACGWEAKGKRKREIEHHLEKKRAKKKSEKSRRETTKDRGRSESKRKKRERDEDWEPRTSKDTSRGGRRRRKPKDEYEDWDYTPSEQPPSRGRRRRRPPEDEYEEWGPREDRPSPKRPRPLKVPCKCGGTIVVKSSKRPVRIKCNECGRTGVLKSPAPMEREPSEYPETPTRAKRRDQREYEESLWGGRREEEIKYCQSCGTRLSANNFCPRCSTTREPYSRTFVSYDQPYSEPYRYPKDQPYSESYDYSEEQPYTESYPPQYEPPRRREERRGFFGKRRRARESEIKKPKKGKCQECGSKNLRFYDDGTGRCPNCGRTFQWLKREQRGSRRGAEDRYDSWDRSDRRRPRAGYEPPKAENERDEEFYCPECGLPMRYISEYQQYYCDYCKEYE